nr:hypothetical protein [Tanacetum cinerariifolium]
MEHVINEAVHKELGDSLVRAATTTSSLEAEQDSGTSLGGGPRCQEVIGDTTAQTRFKSVSKHSNDSLLVRGNEIASLKRRVKKLERRNRSRTHKLKRLYKVGLTAKVESSDNEESLGKDSSIQGRIKAIDADEYITIVNVQADVDKDLGGEEDVDDEEPAKVKDVLEVVRAAKLITEVVTTAGATTSAEATKVQSKDKGKVILIEEPNSLKGQAQIEQDEAFARQLEAELYADINWNTVVEQVKRSERLNDAVMKYQALKRKPFTEAQAR